jgi:glycosyltransferase involved in cell wall biosynthesis
VRTAIVYDRVNKWGGAERVLLALHEIFPKAPLYTAVYSKKDASWANVFPKVIPSFLQNLPFTKTNHEFLGAFTPTAFESMDFSKFDLVISVTSEAAKGIITKPNTLHICYLLTPTRYLWSAHDFYFKSPPKMFKKIPLFWNISRPFVAYLRKWDLKAAKRPGIIVSISSDVQKRVKKYYKRGSKVIFPPVDVNFFSKGAKKAGKKGYFLLVGRFTPYKKVDLAIEAFNKLTLPLYIVGTGSEEKELKEMANKNIKFFGQVSDEKLRELYQEAEALIFPQEEDFGIVAVEAQAAGTCVIAFNKGGARDTVIDNRTGVLFNAQNADSLVDAVRKFKTMSFRQKDVFDNAKRFSKERFKREFKELVLTKVKSLE